MLEKNAVGLSMLLLQSKMVMHLACQREGIYSRTNTSARSQVDENKKLRLVMML
jgi:hypothetical protein